MVHGGFHSYALYKAHAHHYVSLGITGYMFWAMYVYRRAAAHTNTFCPMRSCSLPTLLNQSQTHRYADGWAVHANTHPKRRPRSQRLVLSADAKRTSLHLLHLQRQRT